MNQATQVATSNSVAVPVTGRPLFSLDGLQFRYEPFPIAGCSDVLDRGFYDTLLREWPPHELFQYKPGLGKKYSLSEVNHPEQYRDFIRGNANWIKFHSIIKSPAFIEYVLESTREHNVDIGYDASQLSARFEFSMMGGDGGHIKPHTDSPTKLLTLVIYMVAPGEWRPEYGGGTAILRARDPRKNFNDLNIQLDFDAVERLDDYPFEPNTGVLFVKTFNSYHAVYPVTAPNGVIRRSLTINIENPHDPRMPYLKKHRASFRAI